MQCAWGENSCVVGGFFRCTMLHPTGVWVFLLPRHLDLSQRWRTDLLSVIAAAVPGFGVICAAVDVPAPTGVAYGAFLGYDPCDWGSDV
jgi:hypothetical protein